MKTTQIIAAGLTAGALTLVSCTQSQQQYGLGGAAAGAAISAIVGGDGGDIAKSAAIGGAAGTGYAVYRENQNENRGAYNTGGDTYNQPAPAPQPTIPKYPTANHSDIAGVVVSPYEPYNKVRVTGFKPGDLAKDPTTGKIFVVPQ
ncbi:MAG: hypothetical protein QNK82_03330 [Akkermansiaceae bacterium]|jgi:uncharacterized membrane protein YebE (DUF533 family)|tara:strand:+ start:4140 stop:4577 length:438 start_codon:yes stop_codon:yes gene_type:complete